MAGQLTVDTLKASSGVLATQNGMTGIAKAWVRYNGSTQTVNGSFNVGSVTRNGAGDYTINFTTAMVDANYSASGVCGDGSNANRYITLNNATPFASGSFRFCTSGGGTPSDMAFISITVNGF